MLCFPRLLPALAMASAVLAQSNTVPGRDLALSDTWALMPYQRTGSFPTGATAIGAWTTVCNPGTSPVPFQAAMSADHAFIHYLVARESGGRFVQISNWSYVKHTFGSSNDPSGCGTCAGPGNFNLVEVGCSDTYANSQAVDHFNLGPPDEIDPWLGTWVPTCSYFDHGEPVVSPGQACDGVRSLTHSQASVLNQTIVHQMRVQDADLNMPLASYYWQAGYLVPKEAEANRTNNIGSRPFTPNWTGNAWQFADGNNFLQGSILQRWSGATLNSNTNGVDDGRYYVAVKVSGPSRGVYHYEYAVHNRDNARGMAALHIPVCPGAQVTNFGFHDVDQDPLNEWTAAKVGNEIVFQTTNNPLHWNSLFNFWFDSDAAPVGGRQVGLDQYAVGPGALTVNVQTTVPLGLYNVTIGPGCGSPTAPTLYGNGSPDRAMLGNGTFSLRCGGNAPSTLCAFAVSLAPGSVNVGSGCTIYSAGLNTMALLSVIPADFTGTANLPLVVPNMPALEGLDVDFQAVGMHAGGAYLGTFDLSAGLRVRIGSQLTTCP